MTGAYAIMEPATSMHDDQDIGWHMLPDCCIEVLVGARFASTRTIGCPPQLVLKHLSITQCLLCRTPQALRHVNLSTLLPSARAVHCTCPTDDAITATLLSSLHQLHALGRIRARWSVPPGHPSRTGRCVNDLDTQLMHALHRLVGTMPNLAALHLDVRGTPGFDDQWLANVVAPATGLTSLQLRLDPGGPQFHPSCLQQLPSLRELRHRGDVMDGEHLAALWRHPPLQHAWVEVNLQNLIDFVSSIDPGSVGAALHLKLWFQGYFTHSFVRLLTQVLPDMPQGRYDFYSIMVPDLDAPDAASLLPDLSAALCLRGVLATGASVQLRSLGLASHVQGRSPLQAWAAGRCGSVHKLHVPMWTADRRLLELLAAMPMLRTLCVDNRTDSAMSDVGLQHLCATLPGLHKLSLLASDQHFTGVGLAHVAALSQLTSLKLLFADSGQRLAAHQLTWAAGVNSLPRSLRRLTLDNAHAVVSTGMLQALVGRCPLLDGLELGGVRPEAAWVAVLKRLPLLRSLKLTWARKADALRAADEWLWMMRELRAMHGLTSLRLWPCSERDLLQQLELKLSL